MTARFLELITLCQKEALEPVFQDHVIYRGPFWYASSTKCVKNRYNDTIVKNVYADRSRAVVEACEAIENNA